MNKEKVVTIIFSKDRAFQLEATINSLAKNCTDFNNTEVKVLFTFSNNDFKEDYEDLINRYKYFNNIEFILETDFKVNLLEQIRNFEYVLFLVDDNIFLKKFSIQKSLSILEINPKAIGLSLRLGRNTVYCYPVDKYQKLPEFKISEEFLIYNWKEAELDFNYSLEVSSSIYKVRDLYSAIEQLPVKNPNTLEEQLSRYRYEIGKDKETLICYETSRTFCAPFNKVQNVIDNRDSGKNELSSAEMSKLYKKGLSIDYNSYKNYLPDGCHADVDLLTTDERELISIIIPCYNQGHFITETIDSIFLQEYKNWELIVINDGSTDNTSEVVNEIIKSNPDFNIRLIEKANAGLSAARNTGVKESRGRYFIPLDSDDKIRENFIKKTLEVIKKNPKLGFVYSNIQHFGDRNDIWKLPEFDKNKLIYEDNICCVCSLVKREVFDLTGGYDESMKEGYEDWNFWIAIVKNGYDGYRIDEPLFCYRKRNSSMLSGSNKIREKLIATIIQNHKELYSAELISSSQKILKTESPAKTENKKIKITYLINSILGVTGGNQTLLRTCNEMVKRGYVINVVTYSDKPQWFELLANHIQVPSNGSMADYVPQSDIVISTYFLNTYELFKVKAPIKIYYAQGDQYIFDDTEPELSGQDKEIYDQFKLISQYSYQYDGIYLIPNSKNIANTVKEKYGVDYFDILPVGIDTELYQQREKKKSDDKINILVIGPDIPGHPIEPLSFKGIADVRDALLNIPDLYQKYNIIRISNTDQYYFKDIKCQYYKAPGKLEKIDIFSRADILVYASHYDSCPLPPLEAMASGIAVICTNTGGAKEYCVHDVNSYLIPIKSPQKISEAIQFLSNNNNYRNNLVKEGLKTASQFSFTKMIDKLESIIASLCKEVKTVSTLNTDAENSLNKALAYIEQNEPLSALSELDNFLKHKNEKTDKILIQKIEEIRSKIKNLMKD